MFLQIGKAAVLYPALVQINTLRALMESADSHLISSTGSVSPNPHTGLVSHGLTYLPSH